MPPIPSPFILLQHILPQHALTRLAGRLAASERPWLRDRLIRHFAGAYGIHMNEAARGFGEFTSFNDFFTRDFSRPVEQKSFCRNT